ncbi:hypothetical protein PC9H_011556 [Pleurotus ostreatus]|uniref:Uncharacterized protein n=1 Tax=Pleurotus ostreatus TaxID=5322 RepID=A0A8H6ZIX4_PLEOS|nr:uncharacterized protein PC9H_011556 [Pleurotus ostreatus]KAF7421036.1 hypothetical protein PC9H_011556 [Pleurotus ostreatus]KAJ8690537.1 hypothetical protein PTI98_011961 [Pleurotus ostreatus]
MIQTRVDDRDSRIQYSGGWGKAGSKVEYLGTTTSTSTKGAQFTFSFYGTSIKVFGTLAGTTGSSRAPVLPDAITSYTVDGGEPALFSGKPGNDVQYNQQFFSSGNLSIGTHTIVGTRVNDGSPVYIDYLVVGAPTPESVSGPPVSITWAHSQPATPTRLLATESSSPTSIASPHTTPPVATIIGSIAGGFGLVAIAFALFLWCCHRKRMESIRHRRSFSLFSRGFYTPSQSLSKSDSNSLVSLPSDIIIYREGRRSPQSQPVSLTATSWYGDKLY